MATIDHFAFFLLLDNGTYHNLLIKSSPNPKEDVEYASSRASMIARVMYNLNQEARVYGTSFGQQYILQVGLKHFGEAGYTAAVKEMEQMYKRHCFTPISIGELTKHEKEKAMKGLMLLTEKKDGSKKGRLVYNGKPTREWLSREDASSPTASLESIMLTAVIDAYESRDVMCNDIPNAFIQAPMPILHEGEERIIMKITGKLVDMLINLDATMYGPFVVFEKNERVIYVQVLKAIYGMLQAALLWYQKFKTDLESKGYEFNPYDACVANKMINGKQHTIVFHVDDLKCSHVDPKVNDTFLLWLNEQYGQMGEVKAHRGKVHEYLGMQLDYSVNGKVQINMVDYVKEMISSFPENIVNSSKIKTPADSNLFNVNDKDMEILSDYDREIYHTTVAKGIFLAKRGRPDIQTANAFLSTKVQRPSRNDWDKLIRLLKYLHSTSDMVLTLKADNLNVIKWYVDASFAVHPDFKSHTGAVMSMGEGSIISLSRKQRLNTKSSTAAELVGADDASTLILWTKLFLEKQGYDINMNILYQDNKSAILLENNGRASVGKQSRALNIRYFFLTDQVQQGNLAIQHCSTDQMIGDYMTKPLQGAKFYQFRKLIMGLDER